MKSHIITQSGNIRAKYSIDEHKPLPMSRFVYALVKQFVIDHPDYNYYIIKKLFDDSLIRNAHKHLGVLCTRAQFDEWDMYSKQERYFTIEGPLKSADGIEFYVNTQWSTDDFENILNLAGNIGYDIIRMNHPEGW